MNDERIIYTIHEEMIQSAAEANMGRRLSDKELKRLPCVFMSSPFFDSIYSALIEAAEEAMDNKGNQWAVWDKDYKNTPLERLTA